MAGRVAAAIYRTGRWKRVRRAVLKRDGYRCRRCGKPGRLEVHHDYPIHRFPDRDHFDLTNLLTLCRTCHFGHHRADAMPSDRAEWARFIADGARQDLHAAPWHGHRENAVG